MDIRTTGGPATADEVAAVDSVLGDPESLWEGGQRRPADDHIAYGGRAARSRRHMLLPVLHAVQDRTGWVSRGALEYACRRLSVPPAEAYGVVSFYARFSLDEARHEQRHVCDDVVCLVAGANAGGQGSPCLGLCDRAPATMVERFGESYEAAAEASVVEPAPRAVVSLLRRVGVVDPGSLESYRDHGGFTALERARQAGGEEVIKRLTESRLLGRGGAAFPTGRKWESVASAPAPRYLVCNADESEPGTFKDRVIMEHDPFAVVEGMAVASFATGCEKGFIYIRTEYPTARKRIEGAIAQSRAAGLLDIDIEVRRGAAAYICGEETALFNSIEGKRGEPRNKPPFPVQVGLFGRPTLVNNVETLVDVLDVVTGDFKDTRIFCVSGCVARPGVYEVPMGTPLRSVLDQAGARNIQAVLLGGAAGSFLTPAQLDVPLSFEGTRAIGATLGSGAVIVLDDTVDVKQVLLRIARFFRDESCGQCVPCRVGTKRQEEVLERMLNTHNGAHRESDMTLLSDIAQAMRDASICGLGQTAANAIASGLTQLKVLNG
ncbi:MAG TPA: NADH-ubiquinone oxidoreductase-F iron-sulfur binding region domain-containing protein [Candidatus Dormibacteraeota bacterium]|nr:NADH-ubiquinone oxidoreductase-F iron-sulfur binding region domain-containing protein [Candidatus Dormibacteraeota bacterium]